MPTGLIRQLRVIRSIARLSLHAALRTKTVAALLVLLVVCVIVLPSAVKGDGTVAGDLHILLTYTLGVAFGILCLATLWSACALFAAEIDSARIHLSAVKPVPMLAFWLGKWLALLLLNAILLATVYLSVYARITWRVRSADTAERPVSRRVARPILPSPRAEALNTYRTLQQNQALPEGVSKAALLRTLEEKAVEKFSVLNPGEELHWRFRLTRPLDAKGSVTVRIRFDSEYSTREHVTGTGRIWVSDHPEQTIEVALDDFTLNEIEFTVDTQAFGNLAHTPGGLRDFEVVFRHTGDVKRVSALMLRFRQDVALLTPGGSFIANLARAAFAHWGVLALLAAFGLMLSACFSLPVAAFAATLLMVLSLLANSIVRTVSTEDEKLLRNRVGIWVSRGVAVATRQAVRTQPLVLLTRGEQLDTNSLLAATCWNVILWPALFAAAGCFVLRQRELADTD